MKEDQNIKKPESSPSKGIIIITTQCVSNHSIERSKKIRNTCQEIKLARTVSGY